MRSKIVISSRGKFTYFIATPDMPADPEAAKPADSIADAAASDEAQKAAAKKKEEQELKKAESAARKALSGKAGGKKKSNDDANSGEPSE
jgi:hypothetical protein